MHEGGEDIRERTGERSKNTGERRGVKGENTGEYVDEREILTFPGLTYRNI